MNRLTRDFFDRDTVTVARDLIGAYLVRDWEGQRLVGRITETEAYVGRCDKACHAYQYKRTPRTETLFAPPGHAYVYLIYGMYHCLNLVTEGENEPAAVLIRGMEPVEGRGTMSRLRYGKGWEALSPAQRKNFSNGPGKLCRALSIDRRLNGLDLMGNTLFLTQGDGIDRPILTGPRVGIDYAEEAVHFPWRFRVEQTENTGEP